MSSDENKFELSRNIEHYLAVISKLYAQDGKKLLQEIVVNSQIRVHEAWNYDNLNGGTDIHAVYFSVPEAIYLKAVKQKDKLQEQIQKDINNAHNIQNEFIGAVFLEMEITEERDWRKESGLLIKGKHTVVPETENRIWGDTGYRVFMSHKAEVKKEVIELKGKLNIFGLSSFVAHVDIHPTKEWQDEIESALSSMDAFVAILTEKFHDSVWTDQEVGFAFARGVPIIAIRLGMDPYGFIGKFQALSCSWDTAPIEIVKILMKRDQMLNSYIKAVKNCFSFDDGNKLAEIFPHINNLSDQQISMLISAFNENGQVSGSFGFGGGKPHKYGNGLAWHLNRLTGQKYELVDRGRLELVS